MAKIIEDHLGEKKVHIHTCPKCLSVIEFENIDAMLSLRGGIEKEIEIVICPLCCFYIDADNFEWQLENTETK